MIFSILGCGESIKHYKYLEKKSVGVNDVFRFRKADDLICVDRPRRFTDERRRIILNSNCKRFFTHIEDWKDKPGYRKIKMSLIRGDLSDLDTKNVYPYSNNSPFIACVHAYKMKAKAIYLYGVDFATHPTIKPNNGKLDRSLHDFQELYKELFKRDIQLKVYNKSSALSKIMPFISHC